jgi:hypothetical protein
VMPIVVVRRAQIDDIEVRFGPLINEAVREDVTRTRGETLYPVEPTIVGDRRAVLDSGDT